MKKVLLTIGLAFGMGFSQTVVSKLNGKRIYLSRQEAGHQNGYDGLRKRLDDNKAVYGYTFEYSASPLPQAQLDAVFSRLYKSTDPTPKPGNTIDILVFCQGEGDRNVAGDPFPGAADRMTKINNHVKLGGGLMSVHGAGGREASWHGWWFGARLMTDWFVDGYLASPLISGNGGHFSAGTSATYTLDEETMPSKDSSAYFIRKLQTLAKASKGYGQPLITTEVKSEWYHYNGGMKYEDGTGGPMTHSNNKVLPPAPVRGDQGASDSGIGPVKIFGVVTNGRYVLFNPGHNGDEYTLGNGWMGDFFLSNLRWVVRDDRGSTINTASNYKPLATVNDASCISTSIGRDALLANEKYADLGRISVDNSGLNISINQAGPHSVKVTRLDGALVFEKRDAGILTHRVPGLERGYYLAHVTVKGQSFTKKISIL